MADITILNLKIAKTYLAFTAIKFDLLHHKKPWFKKYCFHIGIKRKSVAELYP